MKLLTITYQRVKNLGNYESERLEAHAEINEDEDVFQAIELLKATVEKGLDLKKNENDAIAF